jgi:hypothetical protein
MISTAWHRLQFESRLTRHDRSFFFSGLQNHSVISITYVFAVLFCPARHFGTKLGTPKPAVFAVEAATSVRSSSLLEPMMRTSFASTSTRWASARRVPIFIDRGAPMISIPYERTERHSKACLFVYLSLFAFLRTPIPKNGTLVGIVSCGNLLQPLRDDRQDRVCVAAI